MIVSIEIVGLLGYIIIGLLSGHLNILMFLTIFRFHSLRRKKGYCLIGLLAFAGCLSAIGTVWAGMDRSCTSPGQLSPVPRTCGLGPIYSG